MSKPYAHILVIDTEQYAGNFEREMCAYITGQTGQCGVGEGYALEYEDNMSHLQWWNNHIVQMPDDEEYSTLRPCAIWATPGWFNNGMGEHYRDTPENETEALEKAISEFKLYKKSQVDMVEQRLIEQNFEEHKVGGWTKQACISFLNSYKNDLSISTLTKHPAYMSVAIFVDEFPPKDVWDDFMKRAQEFAAIYEDFSGKRLELNITGFRQIETKPTQKLTKKHK